MKNKEQIVTEIGQYLLYAYKDLAHIKDTRELYNQLTKEQQKKLIDMCIEITYIAGNINQ